MKPDRLNQWLTLGANLGVLIGIVLLVFELSQNSDMMRAQTRNELSGQIVDLLSEYAGNGELASINHRANNGEDLTPLERNRFLHRQLAMFQYWANVHYQYRQGMYDESEFAGQREAWRRYMNTSEAIANVWCDSREIFAEDFVAEVDALLTRFAC